MKRNALQTCRAFLRKNARLLLCTGLALAAGLLGGLLIDAEAEERAPAPEEGAETVAIAIVGVLPTTEVTLETRFAACGHTLEKALDAAQYVGESEAELAARFPEARIAAFSAKRVRIEHERPGYCPRHVLLLLGTDGMLRVCRTDESSYALNVLQSLGEAPALLEESVAAELTAGVAFDSVDEINAYLENAES